MDVKPLSTVNCYLYKSARSVNAENLPRSYGMVHHTVKYVTIVGYIYTVY